MRGRLVLMLVSGLFAASLAIAEEPPPPDDDGGEEEAEDAVHPLDLLESELSDPSRHERRRQPNEAQGPDFLGPERRRVDFGPITLAASSSLRRPFEDAERDLERLLNRSVDYIFAPSFDLMEAVRNGSLKADIVAVSDPSAIDLLAAENRVDAETRRTFAWNSMVFVQGPGRGRRASVRFSSGGWPTAARIALQFGRASGQKVAIVDPDTTTEGAAARRALVAAGLWEIVVEDLLIVADSEAAAKALAGGDAAFGLVYGATAKLAPNITEVAAVSLRETGLVRYQAAVVDADDAHPDARRLAEALRGPVFAPSLRRYGFLPPAEGRLSASAERDAILADPLLDVFGDPDR